MKYIPPRYFPETLGRTIRVSADLDDAGGADDICIVGDATLANWETARLIASDLNAIEEETHAR